MKEILIRDINELERVVRGCYKCPLSSSRTNTVFGRGNIHSKILIVGEGPGRHEDMSGTAFSGPSGSFLFKIMNKRGFSVDNTYLTNVVKCFPPLNRSPRISEVEACLNYLRSIYIIQKPKLIICLGSIAAKALIDKKHSVMREHGTIVEKKDVVFISTFHPAAILRDESKFPLAIKDWENIKEEAERLKLI